MVRFMYRDGTVPGNFQRDLTDAELRTVAHWVARTMLEIERGHRPAKALQRLMAPHLYHGLENATPPPGARPVAGADIGGVTFFRQSSTAGYAAVAIRELDGTWDALSMVLRRGQPGSWRFIDISRASRYTTSEQPQRTTTGSARTATRHQGRGEGAPA